MAVKAAGWSDELPGCREAALLHLKHREWLLHSSSVALGKGRTGFISGSIAFFHFGVWVLVYFFGKAPSNGAFTRSQFCMLMDFTRRNLFLSKHKHAMKCLLCTSCHTWLQIPCNFSLDVVCFACFLALAKYRNFGIPGTFLFHIRIKSNFRSFCKEALNSWSGR